MELRNMLLIMTGCRNQYSLSPINLMGYASLVPGTELLCQFNIGLSELYRERECQRGV